MGAGSSVLKHAADGIKSASREELEIASADLSIEERRRLMESLEQVTTTNATSNAGISDQNEDDFWKLLPDDIFMNRGSFYRDIHGLRDIHDIKKLIIFKIFRLDMYCSVLADGLRDMEMKSAEEPLLKVRSMSSLVECLLQVASEKLSDLPPTSVLQTDGVTSPEVISESSCSLSTHDFQIAEHCRTLMQSLEAKKVGFEIEAAEIKTMMRAFQDTKKAPESGPSDRSVARREKRLARALEPITSWMGSSRNPIQDSEPWVRGAFGRGFNGGKGPMWSFGGKTRRLTPCGYGRRRGPRWMYDKEDTVYVARWPLAHHCPWSTTGRGTYDPQLGLTFGEPISAPLFRQRFPREEGFTSFQGTLKRIENLKPSEDIMVRKYIDKSKFIEHLENSKEASIYPSVNKVSKEIIGKAESSKEADMMKVDVEELLDGKPFLALAIQEFLDMLGRRIKEEKRMYLPANEAASICLRLDVVPQRPYARAAAEPVYAHEFAAALLGVPVREAALAVLAVRVSMLEGGPEKESLRALMQAGHGGGNFVPFVPSEAEQDYGGIRRRLPRYFLHSSVPDTAPFPYYKNGTEGIFTAVADLDEKVARVAEMGFDPLLAASALVGADGDVSRAVDRLMGGHVRLLPCFRRRTASSKTPPACPQLPFPHFPFPAEGAAAEGDWGTAEEAATEDAARELALQREIDEESVKVWLRGRAREASELRESMHADERSFNFDLGDGCAWDRVGAQAAGTEASPPKEWWGEIEGDEAKLEECAICFSGTSPRSQKQPRLFLRTRCGHTFHADCIKLWCKRKLNCPECRGRIRDVPRTLLKKDAALKAGRPWPPVKPPDAADQDAESLELRAELHANPATLVFDEEPAWAPLPYLGTIIADDVCLPAQLAVYEQRGRASLRVEAARERRRAAVLAYNPTFFDEVRPWASRAVAEAAWALRHAADRAAAAAAHRREASLGAAVTAWPVGRSWPAPAWRVGGRRGDRYRRRHATAGGQRCLRSEASSDLGRILREAAKMREADVRKLEAAAARKAAAAKRRQSISAAYRNCSVRKTEARTAATSAMRALNSRAARAAEREEEGYEEG